jgi:hypothetical protein
MYINHKVAETLVIPPPLPWRAVQRRRTPPAAATRSSIAGGRASSSLPTRLKSGARPAFLLSPAPASVPARRQRPLHPWRRRPSTVRGPTSSSSLPDGASRPPLPPPASAARDPAGLACEPAGRAQIRRGGPGSGEASAGSSGAARPAPLLPTADSLTSSSLHRIHTRTSWL